jgi:murein DD-endopeptidase MepM/ murein hydrolase activator NlpD
VTRRIAALFLVCFLVCFLVVGALAAPPPAAAADEPARDPLALAQQRLDAARAQATELSGKISAAQTDQARLTAEIADAEQRIPELRAHAAELRAEVKQRAADLYMHRGNAAAFETAMDAESAEDALRAAHLTNVIGDRDLELAVEARDTAAKLAAREDELRAQRADLDHTLASLAPLNDLLQQRLTVAAAAYDKVHALLADPTTKHGADVATLASFCPVKGVAVFTDDFGEPREGGPHPGIDLGAVTGTPVVAVVAGVLRHDVGGDGGNGALLLGTDQVVYYYAHFSRYEGDDRIVAAGDVIGYVGQTGNATGPHLHFEIRPGGGFPVDPFATLLSLCSADLPTPRS